MLFSIVVPIYKVEKYLRRCIDSILSQTYSDFELILVDDGSPDAAPKICDEYAAKNDQIHVIHKPNAGLVSARQAGIAAARGDYILNVDGDDWITENLLEELQSVILKHNAPDIIQYNAYRVYADHQELSRSHLVPGYYNREEIERKIIPSMLYDRRQPFLVAMIPGYIWSKAIKRHILQGHYCSDTSVCKFEDFACTYECIYFSNTFYYLNKPLYFYNKMNEGSIMTIYDAAYIRNHDRAIQYITAHLGVQSPEVERQIRARNVSGICIAVFHEIRHGKRLLDASKHIKQELNATTCLQKADCTGLPLHAKIYIFMLRHRMYFLALLVAKIRLAVKGK